jgi:hypothetical protein
MPIRGCETKMIFEKAEFVRQHSDVVLAERIAREIPSSVSISASIHDRRWLGWMLSTFLFD